VALEIRGHAQSSEDPTLGGTLSRMLLQALALLVGVGGSGFWVWFVGSALVGAGTALVYPTLLAAVADVAHRARRGSAVGVHRLWRDSGYALDAIVAGILADALGIAPAILAGGLPALLSTSLVWEDERRVIRGMLNPVANHRVLDAGAGDGRPAVELSAEGVRMTALDLSASMLGLARERARSAEVPLEASQGEIESLPFPPATSHQVVVVPVLCFLPEPHTALLELARVLKPGGSLIVGGWAGGVRGTFAAGFGAEGEIPLAEDDVSWGKSLGPGR